jgi:hypothetical protein
MGGGCEAGTCQPFVVASGDDVPESLGLADDAIYWIADVKVDATPLTRIERCPRPSCTGDPTVIFQTSKTSEFLVRTLVVTKTAVTFIVHGQEMLLEQCGVTDCDGGPKVLAHNALDLAMSLDGGVVFTEYPGNSTQNPANVFRCGASCDPPIPVLDGGTTPTTLGLYPSTFITDGERLLWASVDDVDQEGIWQCALQGCVPSSVTRAPADYVALSTDALYWTEGVVSAKTAVVRKCSLPSCTEAQTLYTSTVPNEIFGGISVDSTRVYFTTPSGVESCPIAGCVAGATQVAAVTGSNGRIAGDDHALYWVNAPQHRLYGLAK